MNDDFILKARLHQQEVEKAMPAILGKETNPIANLARATRTGTSYSQAKAAGEQKRGARFQNKRMAEDIKNLAAGTPTAMSQASTAGMAQQDAEGQSLDPAATVADKGEVANVAAEAAKRAAAAPTAAAPPATGAAPPATGTETPAAPPATGATPPATDAGAAAPAAGGAAAAPAAAAPAATPGLSQQTRDMAQQFQAGQDMQTIQQGKGAEKQTYMKNRSLMGKIFDFGTIGLTSQLGSTGGIARRKANEQSAQQTQQYNQAQSRMNQRAMGMTPVMNSFDSPSSAYRDLDEMIAIRKSIQERNTTDNLRRW